MALHRKSKPSSRRALPYHDEFNQDPICGDERTFYRALARHIIGDPAYHESILHAVLTHYWRVLVDKSNPYHLEYKNFEKIEFGPTTKFFDALSRPTHWLCFVGWQSGSQSILRVITNALNVKIVLWNADQTDSREDGPVIFPEYSVEFVPVKGNKLTEKCIALTPANDGRRLIQFLEDKRSRLEEETDENALRIRRLVWWRDPVEDDAPSDSDSGSDSDSDPGYISEPDIEPDSNPKSNTPWFRERKERIVNIDTTGEDYQCYNEYAPNSNGPPDLVDNPDSFHVYTVVIRHPTQIRSALKLLDDALIRAPGQELPVLQGSSQARPLKRYVALDAEFNQVFLGRKEYDEMARLTDSEVKTKMMAGNPEDLCSILTVAVDRHLVFSFYLLDMLQNPTENTVEEVSYLFEKLIFNKEHLKLWFNFQNDISVLDATIAHMYQATPRKEFTRTKYNSDHSWRVCPTWKINSSWYKGHRPQHLFFPRFRAHADTCDLHDNEGARLNDEGLSCPCRSTGNIDITTVFDFLCRQLGYRDWYNRTCQKRVWQKAREYCNYGQFLRCTMKTDRLFKLFKHFKEAPNREPGRRGISRDQWYQSLGPGMETDSDKMGYNIGDVAGVALLMRFLTTTDDRMLFVTTLWNYMGCGVRNIEPITQYPQKIPMLVSPPPDSPNPYVYLNDYPKSCKRIMIGDHSFPVARYLEPQKVGDLFQGRVDEDRRLLSYFEHDTRAQAARECFENAKKLYGAAGPTFSQVTRVARDAVRAKIFDPLNYTFPRWFTHDVAEPTRPVKGRLPLIRAGVTPYEDLLTLIQDIKKHDPNEEIQLLTTRGIGTSYWYGLPRHIGKTPASTSFELPETRKPLSPVEPSLPDPIGPEVESRLSAANRKSREDARVLRHDWLLQRNADRKEGKAAQTRFDDIFDPRGRNYRRDWNETRDGEVWVSPPPPGTARDEEPSIPEDLESPSDEEPQGESSWLQEESQDRKPQSWETNIVPNRVQGARLPKRGERPWSQVGEPQRWTTRTVPKQVQGARLPKQGEKPRFQVGKPQPGVTKNVPKRGQGMNLPKRGEKPQSQPGEPQALAIKTVPKRGHGVSLSKRENINTSKEEEASRSPKRSRLRF